MSLVPGPTGPVLVMARAGLAGKHLAKPSMKEMMEHTRNTKIAWTVEEATGKSENLRGRKAEVKGGGDSCASAREDVQHCRVPGLNGQDTGGGRKQHWIREEDRSANVGGDTNVLDNTSSGSHSSHIGKRGIEVELAVGDWSLAKGLQGRLFKAVSDP